MNEERIIHDDDTEVESDYFHIPANRPVTTLNDALAFLVKKGKLLKLIIDTPGDSARISCILVVDNTKKLYEGDGVSLNDAIKSLLDRVGTAIPSEDE